jgi:phosphatidylinositol dimannoside acyltransferase
MLIRLRTELRDLMELVLLPGLAAVLPWSLCFRIFTALSHWRLLYREPCEKALAQARKLGWAVREDEWLATRRLVTMVDHADYYLVRTRSDAWLKSHFDVDGNWPSSADASLLCTFHWGAGMWSLRHAVSAGMKVHALVAPLDGAHFAGRRVMHWYAKARTALVAQTLGHSTLDVSTSLRPALRALRNNEQVLAVLDVPADQVSTSQTIRMLGLQARVPKALLRLAVEHEIPVTIFLVGLRVADGQRFLRLRQFEGYSEVDAMVRDVFSELEHAIIENPAAWHFWGEAERFFELDKGRSESANDDSQALPSSAGAA